LGDSWIKLMSDTETDPQRRKPPVVDGIKIYLAETSSPRYTPKWMFIFIVGLFIYGIVKYITR